MDFLFPSLVIVSVSIAIVAVKWAPHLSFTAAIFLLLLVSFAIQLPTHIPESQWSNAHTEGTHHMPWVANLHHVVLTNIASFPGVGAELLPGLTIGVDSSMSESLQYAMRNSSLSHITAVSGSNCAVVVAVVTLIVGFLKGSRIVRMLVGICFLVLYCMVIGAQPSVLRACVMASVMLVSLAWGRPGFGLPLLACAVLILLVWDPWISREPGFVLSVAATAGIVLFALPLARVLSGWIPDVWATLLSVPLAAQLLCQPILVIFTPQISLYGVVANVLAAPAAAVATICGVLACMTIAAVPPVGLMFLWIEWFPAQWIAHTAILISGLPMANVPWLSGTAGVATAGILSVVVLCVFLLKAQWIRIALGIVLGAAVLTTSTILIATELLVAWNRPAQWTIATCDVGQGDALIIHSKSEYALIDTGRYPTRLDACVSKLGISHFTFVMLTHYDKDHVGGLPAVVAKSDVFIVGTSTDGRSEPILKDLQLNNKQIVSGVSGMHGTLGSAQWQILWPDGKHPTMNEGNPGSLTLYLQEGEHDALFTGDLGEAAQNALLSTEKLEDVDVVKVSHHGSADQSARFYRQLAPELSIISVGSENRYGHPREKTLTMLSQLSSRVLRTDQSGMILIDFGSADVSAWSEH